MGADLLDRTGLDLSVPEAVVLAEVVGQRDQEPREELEPELGQLVEELKTDLSRCLE
jgi:hypothetical protein